MRDATCLDVRQHSCVGASNGGKAQPETVLTGGNVADGTGAPALRADLSRVRDVAPGRLYADLLVADESRSGCLLQVGNEENVRTIMRHRSHTPVGSEHVLVGGDFTVRDGRRTDRLPVRSVRRNAEVGFSR